MDSKISVAIISVLVASMVLVAGLPLISGIMSDTVTATNEGAGDLRFNLVDSHVSYTVSIAQNLDDTGIEITNGSDVQTLLYDDASIIYADDNIALWYDLNDLKLICPIDDTYVSGNINDAVQVSRTPSGVEVSIGDPPQVLTFPAPTWAYVANSTGKYGYFENGTEITVPTGTPLATVGSFAGVDCYNGHNNYDLPLALDLTQTGNKLSGAKWISAIVEDEQDAKAVKEIDLKDDDEKEIKDDLGSMVKSVPTPTYTDGDWGYDLYNDGSNDWAIIVSYSGAGGDIVVPAVVGGYDVLRVGKSNYNQFNNYSLMDNSSISDNSTLTISSGIKDIGAYAFNGLSKIKGNFVLPSSVIHIGNNAFAGCGFSNAIISPSVVYMGYDVFNNCSNLETLTINASISTIENGTFARCTSLKSVTIGGSITEIGALGSNTYGAFDGCTSLLSVSISDNVTQIGYKAFNDTGLTNFVIPENVTKLGNKSFGNCSYLSGIVILGDLTNINNDAFTGSNILKEYLNFGTAVLNAGSYGISADATIRQGDDTYIDAMGYLSAVEYTEGGVHTGPTYDLIAILPLVLSAGLVLFCIAVLIRRV